GGTAEAPLTVSEDGDGPSLEVDPDEVEPGGTIEVTGEGFPPDTNVAIEISDANGVVVCPAVETTTDDQGSLNVSYELCSDAEDGNYTVTATPTDGSTGATASLTVRSATGGDDGGSDDDIDDGGWMPVTGGEAA